MIDAGPGERMPAEPARGGGHQVDEAGAAQRRHGIRPRARPLEDVAARIDGALDVAGLARDAHLVLDLVVVRLELLEAERPVFDRRALRHARRAVALRGLAHHLEVPRVEPPRLRPVVQRRAADGVHHRMAAGARGVGLGVGAMRRHFLLRLLHRLRPVAHVVANLIGREVAARQPRAGLEADHVDAGLRERQHRDAAGGAEADHDDVGGLELSGHGLLSACVSAVVLCADAHGLGEHLGVVRRLVVRRQLRAQPLILGRDVGAHAGIADQIPADEVGVAAVVGIAERALQRVRADHGEERRRSCPGSRWPRRSRRRSAPSPDRVRTARGTACRAMTGSSGRRPRSPRCTPAWRRRARRRARGR